jgi:hypothetical protein
MNSTKEYFLYILKCFYTKKDCLPPKENIDYNELYNIAKIHDVQGIIFSVLKEKEFFISSSAFQDFRMDFFGLTLNSITIENNTKILTKTLNDKNIPHILFKGSVVREAYPSKELRVMGDVDVYIPSQYFSNAEKALVNNGFEKDDTHSHNNVVCYSLNDTSFELHKNIASANGYIHSAPFIEYFKNADKHIEAVDKYTYHFEPTFHIFYMLYHLLKHFEHNGCGIKLFLDFPFFCDKYNVDYNILWQYLEKLELKDFCDGVFQFCNYVFGSNLPLPVNKAIPKDTLEYFIEKVLDAGTFGYNTEESYQHRIAAQQARNNRDTSKAKSIVRLIFPDKKSLIRDGYCKENTNSFLMPFIYIKRGYKQVFCKKNLFTFAKAIKDDDNSSKEKDLIIQLGMNK